MKLIGWIFGTLVAIILILFAVSNRMPVTLRIEPLPFAVDLPLYAALLAALVLGFILGALGSWARGLRWRRRAHRAESEAASLKRRLAEAERKEDSGSAALPVIPGAD